jgi:hypothetical protein
MAMTTLVTTPPLGVLAAPVTGPVYLQPQPYPHLDPAVRVAEAAQVTDAFTPDPRSPLHWSAASRLLAMLGVAGTLWAMVVWALLAPVASQ